MDRIDDDPERRAAEPRTRSDALLLKEIVAARADETVGRGAERAEIARAIAAVAGGQSETLAFVGEPGIGKSAMLHALSAEATSDGFAVAAGRATEFEQEVPFAPLAGALDELLGELGADALDELGAERLGELASVFPAFADHAGPLMTTLEAERYRCYDAVRAALEIVAEAQPLLLLLDDLHWADQASLELIATLLRRPPQARVLLALAYRPRQAPPTLAAAVGTAAREGAITILELGPLSEDDASALLGERVDAPTGHALYAEAGGNPFFLIELARAVRSGRRRVTQVDDGVPAAVRASIEQELLGLTRPGRRLLDAAAILGEPFDPAVATRVAQLDAAGADRALDELMALDLIRGSSVPRRLLFRHPIVRRTIYDTIGEGSRIAAHARAAEVLAAQGEPLVALAHHVEQSAAVGDEEAIALLERAGQAAAPRAPAAAARWFTAALRLLAGDADTGRRVQLLIALAAAHGSTGRLEDSRRVLQQALPLVDDRTPHLRARILGNVARLDHTVGRHTQARAILRDALASADGNPSLLAAIEFELAVDLWFSGEWDGMARFAARAREHASDLDDRSLYAAATGALALATAQCGDVAGAVPFADEAGELVDVLSDAELAERVETLLAVAWAQFTLDRYADASRNGERSIAIVRATGQSSWFSFLMVNLAQFEMWRGRLRAAAACTEAAVEAARLGPEETQIAAWIGRCWTSLMLGEIDDAVRAGERAIAITGPQRHQFMYGYLPHCSLGAALLAAGKPQRAREEIRIGGGAELEYVDPAWRPLWFEILSSLELASGDTAAAALAVERAEALVSALGLHGRAGNALRARAALELARGDHARAAAAAADATARFSEVGRPVDAARARLIAGMALAALGRHDEAIGALEVAHAVFATSGAALQRDAAARELRKLGRRVSHRSAGETLVVLTALSVREREVALLVADGLTNKQIAARLFVGEKTIEKHLARAFEKLGVSSRAALARLVEREQGPSA